MIDRAKPDLRRFGCTFHPAGRAPHRALKATRALLIELDEGIHRAEAANAPGGYPGLYFLLDKLEDVALDESWAFLFAWLLAGPWGANLRNDVSHGLPVPMTPAYAALILRAVTVLAVVAGPAPITHVRAGHRGNRDEIIALLADPTGNAGRIGDWLARAATAAERLAWRLHTARLRCILRRRPATPTLPASRPGAAPPRPANPPDGGA